MGIGDIICRWGGSFFAFTVLGVYGFLYSHVLQRKLFWGRGVFAIAVEASLSINMSVSFWPEGPHRIALHRYTVHTIQ